MGRVSGCRSSCSSGSPVLVPPAEASGPEFDAHLKALGGRLAENPLLAGRSLADRGQIEEALQVLSTKSDAIVREAASSVFLATAVSQSGRLDGFLVLAAQTKMVWKIAHLYHQRPTVREMTGLYANVAGTAFLAGEMQDLDLAEGVEPILSSAIGSLGASVPGLHVAGTILANCVLSGSANAFLTLRVGMIARRYCAATTEVPRSALRRAATAEAAKMLGGIVSEGTSRISRAIFRASVARVGGAVDLAKDAGAKLLARVGMGHPSGV